MFLVTKIVLNALDLQLIAFLANQDNILMALVVLIVQETVLTVLQMELALNVRKDLSVFK